MPPPPVPLSADDKLRYDEIYQYLGQKEADSWATGLEQRRIDLGLKAPPPPTTPPTPVAPPVVSAPAPRLAPEAPPIIGTTPAVVPLPEQRVQLQDRPGIPKLIITQDELAKSAIDIRTTNNQKRGMSFEAARAEAEDYVRKAREAPRTVAFKPKAVPGYSELAIRGEELLPKMGAMETVFEAMKPQVLETEAQAEGRRQFERTKSETKARLKERADRDKVSIKDVVDREALSNSLKADEMARRMYPPEEYTRRRQEILAGLNAPLYAASEEFKGTPPGEVFSKFATDTLRGLTQQERYGRLVETQGAAVLRNVGGLSRIGVEAMREVTRPPVEFAVSEYVAKTTPMTITDASGVSRPMTGADIRAATAERREKEGIQRVATAPTYEPGFAERQRLETGSFTKDVAYQVATGRSMIDDYIDVGIPVGYATALGVVTEFALPNTPVGYLTDVLPAIKTAGTAARLGRGAGMVGAGAIGASIGSAAGPIGAVAGGGVGALLASKPVSRALSTVADIPEAIRITRYINDQVKTASDLGRVMERPKFWKVLSSVSDARVNLATRVADDAAEFAATRSLIQSGETETVVNKFIDAIERGEVSSTSKLAKQVLGDIADAEVVRLSDFYKSQGRAIPATIKEDALNGVINEIKREIKRAGVSPSFEERLRETFIKLEKDLTGPRTPDIIRNTYAKAVQSVKSYDDILSADDVLATAIAETLEKVPSSKYMYVTPRILLSKDVVASEGFRKAVSDVVKNLPPSSTMDDVTKAIEDVIKSKYSGSEFLKGKIRAGELAAEPAAVMTPFDAEGFITSVPRGGLERLATPEARRPAIIEIGQDIRDTVAALFLSPKDGKLISESFANSTDMASATRMIDSAMKQRIPTPMRDFLSATKSEIDALATTRLEGVPFPINLVPGLKGRTRNILIDAIRAQGPDGLNKYIAARIAADSSNPSSLRASRVTGEITDVTPWAELPIDSKVSAIETITRKYFGDSIKNVVSPDADALIKKSVLDATEAAPDSTTAVLLAVKNVRKEFPELAEAGRRLPMDVRDDLASAMFEYVIEQEAKVIFTDNFYKAYPDLQLNTEVFVPRIRSAVMDALDTQFFSSLGIPNNVIDEVRKTADITFSPDILQKELAEFSRKFVNEELGADFISPFYHRNPLFGQGVLAGYGPQTRAFIDKLIEIDPSGMFATRVAAILIENKSEINNHVRALKGFLYQNRVIRPVTETDVLTFISNNLYVPLTRSQKEIAETLLGPINDLTKGTGNVANNLDSIYRAGGGLGESLSTGIRSFFDTMRTLSLPGMTAGVYLPNLKFHAVNYLSAPFVLAVTSPGAALQATLGEVSKIIPISKFQEANASFVRSVARDANKANNVAFTSDTGIPYTYKQLDNFMNENYFGMSNEVFAFGNQFGQDVRIELGLSHRGTPVSGLDKYADPVLRYLNVTGPGQYVKVAASVDTNWRHNIFLAALKNGETIDGARRIARNAVLDYGRIPSDLRRGAARYMSFFSWFAMSNAELFGSLFRPKAISAVGKQIRAQRELHKGFGEWQYAEDSTKKKMWSYAIGQYDDLPAFFVGPENPWAGPLIDQSTLALGIMSLSSDVGSEVISLPSQGVYQTGANLADISGGVADVGVQFMVEKSFTPTLKYLEDIGAFGDTPKGKVVPPRQIMFHRAMGDDHFALWLAHNNIGTLPIEERRLGEPTFYGQQYVFLTEDARKKAARDDLVFTMLGLNRMVNDYSQIGLIALPLEGVDKKRYERTSLGLLTYILGANLQKGTTEHEAMRNAIIAANKEISAMEGN